MIKKKSYRGLLVGVCVFILAMVLYQSKAFRVLEWKTWDWRLQFFSNPLRADSNIVLIMVDQNSLDLYSEQGIAWPWWRQMYAPLIKFCNKGGARSIFFDFIFSESSVYGVEDDSLFAQAISGAGNVFLPLFLSREEKVTPPDQISGIKRFSLSGRDLSPPGVKPMNSATLPIKELLHACRGAGNVQITPDRDGIYRRVPLYFSMEEDIYPALPLAMAGFSGAGSDAPVPVDDSGQMVIRFHGPSGTYKTYSAAAVINSFALMEAGKKPQIPPETFKNKIVLIGASAPGLLDLKPSPFSSVYPGTEIQASVLDNLLHQDYIRFPPLWIFIFVLVFISILAGLGTTLISKTWQVVLFAFFCVALSAAVSCAAFLSGYWFEFVIPEFAVLLSIAAAVLLNYNIEGRQRRFIKRAFNHYLSPHVIERVLDDPSQLKLGGENRDVSSFFSDVAGFTSISEGLSPDDLVRLLNDYLSEMTNIILESGGTLDKYEGDAIIAFWNAPLDFSDHAVRACRAALACQQRLAELRPRFRKIYGHPICIRIGVNSGPAVVGNMGSQQRFDYTAMGDTINLASRLEGACKQYGIDILAGENTYEKAKDVIAAREIDLIRVVGKQRPVRVYEIMGELNDLPEEKRNLMGTFKRALDCYRERKWEDAMKLFAGLKGDKPAGIYMERCRQLLKSPPPDSWDGVMDLKIK
jgi:adenylate cyclase